MKHRIAALTLLFVAGTLAGGAYAQTTSTPMTHSEKKATKAQEKADKKSSIAQAEANKKKTDAQAKADNKKADADVDAAKKQ